MVRLGIPKLCVESHCEWVARNPGTRGMLCQDAERTLTDLFIQPPGWSKLCSYWVKIRLFFFFFLSSSRSNCTWDCVWLSQALYRGWVYCLMTSVLGRWENMYLKVLDYLKIVLKERIWINSRNALHKTQRYHINSPNLTFLAYKI